MPSNDRGSQEARVRPLASLPDENVDGSLRKRHRPNSASLSREAQELSPLRKRVRRACDRCRLKKTKCSGETICERCRQDGAVCVTSTGFRKLAHTQCPKYTSLVETQRDRLAHVLHELLQHEGLKNLPGLDHTLVKLGIDVDNLVENIESPGSSTNSQVSSDKSIESTQRDWDQLRQAIQTSKKPATNVLHDINFPGGVSILDSSGLDYFSHDFSRSDNMDDLQPSSTSPEFSNYEFKKPNDLNALVVGDSEYGLNTLITMTGTQSYVSDLDFAEYNSSQSLLPGDYYVFDHAALGENSSNFSI